MVPVVRLLHAARSHRTAVYFYFLPVTPIVLLLRCGGPRRTELPSCSRHPQQVITTGGLYHKSLYSSIRFYNKQPVITTYEFANSTRNSIHLRHHSNHVISNHRSGMWITRMYHVIRMTLMQIHEFCLLLSKVLHKYQLLVVNSYIAI